MKLDLASSYAASFARVASWAIVAGLVYRNDGEIALAVLTLQRAVLTVMMLGGLGLSPALVILLPQFRVQKVRAATDPTKLDYATPELGIEGSPEADLLSTGFKIALRVSAALILLFILVPMAGVFLTEESRFWQIFFAGFPSILVCVCIRLLSDVLGAWLQTHDHLSKDNAFQAVSDAIWIALALLIVVRHPVFGETLPLVLQSLVVANAVLFVARFVLFMRPLRKWLYPYNAKFGGLLLTTGSVLLLSQGADLLYAPANQAIIQYYLSSDDLAVYAPLLHLDAGLLLGVAGLANLLLPKTAIAHGAGERRTVRRYYIGGSLFSLIFLGIGALCIWALAGRLFEIWFGNSLPATRAILPFVMIHTVVGGTASIGRSVLFGIGRARAYTIASVIGGITNVVLAITLVTQTHLGLMGIVWSTIITVTIRCAIWMPWYTLRALRQGEAANRPGIEISALSPSHSPLPPL